MNNYRLLNIRMYFQSFNKSSRNKNNEIVMDEAVLKGCAN
jgi:hypothetical protein